jgi:hypothetical protein
MQSVQVRIKKVVPGEQSSQKIHLELVDTMNAELAIAHFEGQSSELSSAIRIGNILTSTVTMVKDYGVVTSLPD